MHACSIYDMLIMHSKSELAKGNIFHLAAHSLNLYYLGSFIAENSFPCLFLRPYFSLGLESNEKGLRHHLARRKFFFR